MITLQVPTRRLAISHLHTEDPKAPNIHRRPIILARADQFWSHPLRCADHALARVVFFGEDGARAQVGEFDFAGAVEQDVFGFYVSMYYLFIMQVLNP